MTTQIPKNDCTGFSIQICVIVPNRCNQRFLGFFRNLRKGGESKGNRWSPLLRSCEAGNQEGRKVRAPQGRVVRNTDCLVCSSDEDNPKRLQAVNVLLNVMTRMQHRDLNAVTQINGSVVRLNCINRDMGGGADPRAMLISSISDGPSDRMSTSGPRDPGLLSALHERHKITLVRLAKCRRVP